jgi:hypothetical protein
MEAESRVEARVRPVVSLSPHRRLFSEWVRLPPGRPRRTEVRRRLPRRASSTTCPPSRSATSTRSTLTGCGQPLLGEARLVGTAA